MRPYIYEAIFEVRELRVELSVHFKTLRAELIIRMSKMKQPGVLSCVYLLLIYRRGYVMYEISFDIQSLSKTSDKEENRDH
jgi:hypothetical protein